MEGHRSCLGETRRLAHPRGCHQEAPRVHCSLSLSLGRNGDDPCPLRLQRDASACCGPGLAVQAGVASALTAQKPTEITGGHGDARVWKETASRFHAIVPFNRLSLADRSPGSLQFPYTPERCFPIAFDVPTVFRSPSWRVDFGITDSLLLWRTKILTT